MTDRIFEVDSRQIGQLTDQQLTSLLNRLLILEAEAHAIAINTIEVGLNIKTGDGGIDASIRWDTKPAKTKFLPSNRVVFQCKAENMGPAKCASELVAAPKKGEPQALKALVAEALRNGDTYILFTTGTANGKQKTDRITAMRTKLKELGTPKSASAKLLVWSAEDIARWTNDYLPAIVYVQAVTGRATVPGLKTYTEWLEVMPDDWAFHSSTSTNADILAIRKTMSQPRQAIRLNGLPGLGKTRLALESLGPTGGGPGLAPHIVYYDAEFEKTELTKHVFEWIRQGRRGVLIVDNCLPDVHLTLQAEVLTANSKFSLMTIYSNPSENLRNVPLFLMSPLPEKEISALAMAHTPGLSEADADVIAHMSGGFIFFANLLCGAFVRRMGIDDVLLRDNELLKFLWGAGNQVNEPALRTIEACSLFESLDYMDGDTDEAKSAIAISQIDRNEFSRRVREFIKRGIIEKTGRFIRVRPHPLALSLCRTWWEGVSPHRAKEVFEAIPRSMVDPLCERLKMLNTLPEAREVTAKLCEPTAPFGQAEVLFSARGARIFRALAEVNPEVTSERLHDVICATSLENLRNEHTARREWVWTLTKLIFHKRAYTSAAQSLLRLALAENERFANNATGTLVQTFQIVLPGTEATLDERADFLADLFLSEDEAVISIALSAADAAMRGEYFSRTGGAEHQGSSPSLDDYEASTFEEVHSYWSNVLASIAASVEAERCTKSAALSMLAGHIRSFVRAGVIDLAGKIIEMANRWKSMPWEDGLEAIRDTIRFDIDRLEESERILVKSWVDEFTPNSEDIDGQLSLYVSRPGWSEMHLAEPNSDSGELPPANQKVRELAQLCANNFSEWSPHLNALFFGEQRLGYAFGEYLAERLRERDAFLELVLMLMLVRSQSQGRINLIVLAGFVHAISKIDRPWSDAVVERLLSDNELHEYAIDIIAYLYPDLPTLLRLVQLLADGRIDAGSLTRFSFGGSLNHLPANDVSTFILALSLIGEEASWVALEIGYMSFFSRADVMWPGLRLAMRTLLLSGRLKFSKIHRGRDVHSWAQVALKILEERDDSEFSIAIARQLVSAATENVSSFDLPDEVAEKLLKLHAQSVWPVFADALLGDNPKASWNLGNFLGRGMRGNAEESKFPLASLDESILEKWLRTNKKSAKKAAGMVKLIDSTDGELAWTKLGRLFIEEFGQDVQVLHAINSNLMSGVFWGPRTQYFQKLTQILSEFDGSRVKSVRDWVRSFKAYLKEQIAAEQNTSDAQQVGRW
ncbi:hypothetical protein SAMN04515618_10888 [Collimonas sp. OK307]|uniref:hypothetical protein n=1 Tax=Collimonas sp. OK307 TaxID=1801620 RepID=UPI0008F0AEF2|nr:hypothetical protein [Collimonas sp. OK307]SFI02969.1 hypothetical protein SAMN04515618_10888 [Collimonas sp. OK307]